MRKAIVVVDPFSAGSVLPQYINEHGFDCIIILSDATPEIYWNRSQHQNHKHIYHINQQNKQSIINILEEIRPIAVIAGSDWAVELADWLSTHLSLPTNVAESPNRRRDKFWMQECVRICGLRSIPQALCRSVEEAVEWARSIDPQSAFIVKPTKSTANDLVFLCQNEQGIRSNAQKLLNNDGLFREKNYSFIIQKFIEGREYTVNSVSMNGSHFVTDIAIYHKHKIGNYTDWDIEFFQPSNYFDELIVFNNLVLDALNVNFGAAHAEFILSADGPYLVEIGARFPGTNIWQTVCNIAVQCPINLTIDSYTNPERYYRAMCHGQHFKKCAMIVILTINEEGEIRDIGKINEIRQLKSYSDEKIFYNIGDVVERTTNQSNIGGIVELIHEDRSQIHRDRNQIRQWNNEHGIFEIS